MTKLIAPKQIRCAIYTRKSSEEGLDQAFNSLHAQREACEAFVASQKGEGWSPRDAVYDDGGFSGGNLERPALRRLLADIDARKMDVVVVYKVDRLTRSLTDFAKIVDRFDASGVSFVSVTQAFNTTTSMGRLTLNVLLSFAQFEREVTGERIRDKIAASKAKGMWMGGNLPLGYDLPNDPLTRALVVNEPEADLVRAIFSRYLQLKSVHALQIWLDDQGLRSKVQMTTRGDQRGGGPFSRGALFYVLKNRTYLGEIPHKDKSYPGAHPAIVDQATFDAAQVLLRENGSIHRQQSSSVGKAPLRGRICDAQDRPMQPTFTQGRGGRHYRYYVVSAEIRRQVPDLADGLHRISAPIIEQLLMARLPRLAGLKSDDAEWSLLLPALKSVTVGASGIELTLHPGAIVPRATDPADVLDIILRRLAPDERATADSELRVFLKVRPSVRGGRTWLSADDGRAVTRGKRLDEGLVRALRAGHALLRNGDEPGPANTYERRLCGLALLAPDIQRAILAGRQPAELTLDRLISVECPLAWADQRSAFGFEAV